MKGQISKETQEVYDAVLDLFVEKGTSPTHAIDALTYIMALAMNNVRHKDENVPDDKILEDVTRNLKLAYYNQKGKCTCGKDLKDDDG